MEGVGKLGEIHAQLTQRAVVDELRGGEHERLLARVFTCGGDSLGMGAGKGGGRTAQPRFIGAMISRF